MSLRDKYKEISEQIKKLDEQASAIYTEIENLSNEQNKLLQSIIIEEKSLEGSSWELRLSGDRAYLLCSIPRSDEANPLHDIETLMNNTYHYSFDLEDGIEINIDDDISLHFDENKMVIPTIKKYKLKVSSVTIAAKMQALKRQVSQLELLAHQFNIKN